MKVLIVEDDFIVRQGIIYSIDWEKNGLSICGQAVNGMQGLELLEEMKPEIVITDIRMPIMDGIMFSQKVKEKYPETEIIILSGYDDFTYAKQAIHIGVHEYLLKPIDADTFLECVCRLKDQLEEKNRVSQNNAKRDSLLKENRKNIYEHLLNKMIRPSFKEQGEQILAELDSLGIVFTGIRYRVLLLTIEDFLFLTQNSTEEEKSKTLEHIKNILYENFSEQIHIECFLTSHFQFAILMDYFSVSKLYLEECCKNIVNIILEKEGFFTVFSCGKEKNSIYDICVSYEESVSALRYHVCEPGQGILFFEGNMKKKKDVFIETKSEEKALLECMQKYDDLGMKRCMEAIFQKALEEKQDYNQIRATSMKVILLLISHLEEMGIAQEETMILLFEIAWKIKQGHSFKNLQYSMGQFLKEVANVLHTKENEKYSVIVRGAIQYVEENYQKEMSVKTIASEFYVTPNYFSQIFKAQMGMNFTEYLNELRIKKAKQLLQDAKWKVYEVAEQTGYQNYKYFNKVFKKYTGFSPKEYRNMMEQK